MKELIHLAEQFLEIAKIGFCDQDLKEVGVRYDNYLGIDLESVNIGGKFTRTFSTFGNSMQLDDTLLFNERTRSDFIEEFSLKLNEVRSVVKINRQARIDKQIQDLESQRNLEAA